MIIITIMMQGCSFCQQEHDTLYVLVPTSRGRPQQQRHQEQEDEEEKAEEEEEERR
jgi:hypothetical protein